MVYYNEKDPFAAAWLNELIRAKVIADGVVDERSIADVTLDDVQGFTQCHFFAGIGVWSYALRQAGWPDDRQVWTGSCPCQPFSASGKRKGFDDDRHLWPVWANLIALEQPATIFGEQVASPDGLQWFDLVSTDLEDQGYAVGSADLCAASVGAPHIRQRLYFVADSTNQRHDGRRTRETGSRASESERPCDARELADTHNARSQGRRRTELSERPGQFVVGARGTSVELGYTESETGRLPVREWRSHEEESEPSRSGEVGSTSGFWNPADWIYCRDEKYRPVEPGTFPLVTGAACRVGRLRGYGNALCAEVAKTFIEAYMSI